MYKIFKRNWRRKQQLSIEISENLFSEFYSKLHIVEYLQKIAKYNLTVQMDQNIFDAIVY